MPISPLNLLDRVLLGRNVAPVTATSMLPLQGLTVLVVEDSRFASDAMRLLCQRSGARMRRVDTLQAAYAHLRVYRPDVMLVDLGLPDGRGEALIFDVVRDRAQGPVVIGISGDPGARATALLAGAHGFLEKPLPNMAGFQAEILRHLPDRADRSAPNNTDHTPIADPLALKDDLAHAATILRSAPTPSQRQYVTGFVAGIARSSGDQLLAAVADQATNPQGTDGLRNLVDARLRSSEGAFEAKPPER